MAPFANDATALTVAVRTTASVLHVPRAGDAETFVLPALIRDDEAVAIFHTIEDHAPFCEIAFR
jgi:hypothetical protein